MSSTKKSLIFCGLLAVAASASAAMEEPRQRFFEFTYEAEVRNIPEGARRVEVWLPYPESDPYQNIGEVKVEADYATRVTRDLDYGNAILYLRAQPPRQQKVSVRMQFTVLRKERRPEGSDGVATAHLEQFLSPNRLVPIDGVVARLAAGVTVEATTDLQNARAIYDFVSRNVTYDKSGEGWGQGDALYACTVRRGNCTDFHALLIGMARAVGIPSQFEIGFPLPHARGSGAISGYHCWAALHLTELGWWPVDSSEASKHPELFDYYFGAHDENRVQLSVGRDIVLTPPPEGEPINYFIYPYVEIDGRAHKWVETRFYFKDLPWVRR